jgi:hypothetical protein
MGTAHFGFPVAQACPYRAAPPGSRHPIPVGCQAELQDRLWGRGRIRGDHLIRSHWQLVSIRALPRPRGLWRSADLMVWPGWLLYFVASHWFPHEHRRVKGGWEQRRSRAHAC